ncbi:MAG: DnaB-like helicase C-terminal domain-containing protein [Trueperaceae bacterium]
MSVDLSEQRERAREALQERLSSLLAEHRPEARKSGTGWRLASLEGGKGDSLSISSDGVWQDFATGEKGDVFDLVAGAFNGHAKLDARTDFPRVLERAHELLGWPPPAQPSSGLERITLNGQAGRRSSSNGENTRTKSERPAAENLSKPDIAGEPPEWLTTLCEGARSALQANATPEAARALEYLRQRGITSRRAFGVIDKTVTKPAELEAGYWRALQGRLLILYSNEADQLAYYNARDLTGAAEERYKYLKPAGVSMSLPFNAQALQVAIERRQALTLTEGEMDAASLLEAYGSKHPVIGCSGGKLPAGWPEKIAAAGVEVLILSDDDAAGREKARELQERISSHPGAGRVTTAALTPHKDASAALQALGPAGLIEAVENALQAAKAAGISDYLYVTTRMLEDLDARANRKHSHYSTGLEALDNLLGGGYLEGLHLLGGVTGGGKTSLALSIATHNASHGRHVLYVSYEQSKLELWARIANRVTGVPRGAMKSGWYDTRNGKEHASETLRNSERWSELQDLARHLLIVEGGDALSRQQGKWSIGALADTARAAADAQGAPPLIILDYLQRIPVPENLRIRDIRERVGAVAGMLQTTLGRDLSAPILALSSVGRASYNAEAFAKLPAEERLAAFKEAGELEYTSYTALLLHSLPETKRGQVMQPHTTVSGRPAFNPRALDLVKNREGNTGRLAVKWHPERDEWLSAMPYGKDSEPL